MKRDYKASFQITSWNEETVGEEKDGSTVKRAVVTQTYKGDMEGTGTVSYVMFYRDQKTADFIGFEQFEGEVKGKNGAFVMRHDGVFKDGKASSDWIIEIGSGSGELDGITGDGSFKAGHAGTARVNCRIALAK